MPSNVTDFAPAGLVNALPVPYKAVRNRVPCAVNTHLFAAAVFDLRRP